MPFGFENLFGGKNKFLSLLFGVPAAVDAYRQQEQARIDNERLGKGLLDLYHQQGGRDTSGYAIPSMFGHQLASPYDTMGELRKLEEDIAGRIRGNTQASLRNLRTFGTALNSATDRRGRELLDAAEAGEADLRGQYGKFSDDLMAAVRGRTAETLSTYDRLFGGALGSLQDRYTRGMRNLEGAGAQARRDIDTQYAANEGKIAADLAARGLGGSTILSSMKTGNLREKMDTIGRLEESLRRERAATDAALSGDIASAQMHNAATRTNLISGLRGDEISTQGDLGRGLLDMNRGFLGNRMNLLNTLTGERRDATVSLADLNRQIRDAGAASLTNWAASIGGQRQNLGNAANAGYMSTLSGVNYQYPQMSPYDIMMSLGRGLGGYEAGMDAINTAKQRTDQAITASALGIPAGIGGAMLGVPYGGFSFRF